MVSRRAAPIEGCGACPAAIDDESENAPHMGALVEKRATCVAAGLSGVRCGGERLRDQGKSVAYCCGRKYLLGLQTMVAWSGTPVVAQVDGAFDQNGFEFWCKDIMGFAMSKAAGLVLILAGLGFGALALAQSNDAGPRADAAQLPTNDAVAKRPILKPEVVPVPQHAALAPRISSNGVTTVARRMGEPRTPPQRFAIPKGREALARELQKELRRVGCYEGEISGTWSQSTRRAMRTFIERMNARLPIEEPDAVLYTMVKGQPEPVCGKPCAAAEAQTADGRCVPASVLQQAKSKPVPASVTTAAIEKPAAAIVGRLPRTTPQSADASKNAVPQFAGRMGLAGPSVGPTLGTPTRAPRYRATHVVTSAVRPRAGQGAQRWSSAIFSQKMSNN